VIRQPKQHNAYDPHNDFGSTPSVLTKNKNTSQPKLEIEKDIVITHGARKTQIKDSQMSAEDTDVIGLLNQEPKLKSGDSFE